VKDSLDIPDAVTSKPRSWLRRVSGILDILGGILMLLAAFFWGWIPPVTTALYVGGGLMLAVGLAALANKLMTLVTVLSVAYAFVVPLLGLTSGVLAVVSRGDWPLALKIVLIVLMATLGVLVSTLLYGFWFFISFGGHPY
jgi:succinate dehydrogenase hydrophobic anchor subunit